ncbi:MAG: UDP-N-acetylmuramoyl-L-alanyl-D-glutamate--2,6-diaminopimelate ligase [Alphaproteobacteria bacterium]|nr:UDP-N-acetylmuramoyl-L-alanyl-D-glutamate--2,6-diaminopimelate ligase [Alphaproteobacteria bacterium]
MNLDKLLKQAGVEVSFSPSHTINKISCDSRNVEPNDLFVSIPCSDSLTHAQSALEKGAKVFISTKETCDHFKKKFIDVIFISVLNPRLKFTKLVQAFYPKQPKTIIAITGTNGKSSIVNMLRQLWELAGIPAASLGTLGLTLSSNAHLKEDVSIPNLTSLGPLDFHKTLQSLKESDIDHLAAEASSHGLDQYRMHGAHLSAAAFTNLTQDHLEYHKTLENYFNAKAKLFSEILPDESPAVINADSPYFEKLAEICKEKKHNVISYSLTQKADFYVENIQQHQHSIQFDLVIYNQVLQNQTINLAGLFQLENLLCALALAQATGVPISTMISSLSLLKSAKGRMEYVASKNGAPIFVDYAHTPDALEGVLKSLRPHVKGKLWVVFGCGGNRDTGKRPQMGKIAEDLADKVIVTDDNPRLEDPASIRSQILETCPKAIEIGNRSEAIAVAIAGLNKDDILLIAGKGHESGQTVGTIVYPFSDQAEVLKHL